MQKVARRVEPPQGASAELKPLPLLIGGELESGSSVEDVRSPYTGEIVGRACIGSAEDVRRAIHAAAGAARAAREMPSHARAAVLERIRAGLLSRRDRLVELLALEAGKPVSAGRLEVDRMLFVFDVAAEESKRMGGELLPLDLVAAGERRWGLTRRFPIAPIAGIVPFNFPLLLTAHKLAPAIACGATIVMKPPPQDPLTSLLLAEVLAESGYPAGGLSVVPCSVADAAPLLDDPRVRMVSFTGSARAGWAIRRQASRMKVVLELGGNAAVVVEPDADLEHVATRCALGGYAYAGQSCISVQRILVHEDVHDEFVERFTERVEALTAGDPLEESTDVGPLIDEGSAQRAQTWIEEAVRDGARLATGGQRTGTMLQPTVLLDTRPDMKVNCEEVFAPVTTVRPYARFDAALEAVNDSPYGLQAGLFTRDIGRIWRAFEMLEVGGIVINDIPGFRVDHMPYGGVKDSGQGREGVRYAMEEMTEIRLLTLAP
ncbi:MAG: aldehyde dehydrogenase family protein [Gemmatimonadetes bacterium]|nr:aldehyde dehydrogenase family protein [Gemmatimonadota bacterium]